mgnify:CR=1 FL=1
MLVTHSIEEAVFLGRRILALGRPPLRSALVVENPGAGDVAYRDTATFHEICAALRAHRASSGS